LFLTYHHLEYANSDIIGVFLHSSQQGYQIRLRTKKDFRLLGSDHKVFFPHDFGEA